MNYRQRKYNEGQETRNDIYRFLVKYLRNTDICLLMKKLWMEQDLQSVPSRDI